MHWMSRRGKKIGKEGAGRVRQKEGIKTTETRDPHNSCRHRQCLKNFGLTRWELDDSQMGAEKGRLSEASKEGGKRTIKGCVS